MTAKAPRRVAPGRRAAAFAAILAAAGAAGCEARRALVAPLNYGAPQLAPEESFRTSAPEAEPIAPAIALPWRMTALPNGMRLAILERHTLPVASLALVLDRGEADVRARSDAYALLGRALHDGTEVRSAPDLVDAWAGIGAAHGSSLGRDGGELWAKVVAADADKAMALLAEMATRPRLTAARFDHLRALWTRDVTSARFNQGSALARNTHALLFGRDHAYGYRRIPVAETNALRIEDLSAIHAQIFQPAHTTLVVVGDVAPETIEASAARLFGGWAPRAAAPLPANLTLPPEVPGARGVHVAIKGAGETLVSILARGPAMGSPDLLALEILARNFGGLSSRMRGDVRVDQGAAYFFGADVTHYRTASFLTIHAVLAAPKAVPALRSMLDTLAAAARAGISEAELTRARTSLLAAWRTEVSTTGTIASHAAGLLAGGAGLDDLERYPARLQAVTLADVARVAAKYLAPGALRVVVLGTPSLRPDLEELGLGPFELRDEWSDFGPSR